MTKTMMDVLKSIKSYCFFATSPAGFSADKYGCPHPDKISVNTAIKEAIRHFFIAMIYPSFVKNFFFPKDHLYNEFLKERTPVVQKRLINEMITIVTNDIVK